MTVRAVIEFIFFFFFLSFVKLFPPQLVCSDRVSGQAIVYSSFTLLRISFVRIEYGMSLHKIK